MQDLANLLALIYHTFSGMFRDFQFFETCCHPILVLSKIRNCMYLQLCRKVNRIGSKGIGSIRNETSKTKTWTNRDAKKPHSQIVPSLMFKLLPKIMIFDSPCTAQAQKVVATCTAISTVPKISSIFWSQYLKLEPMSGHM